MSRNTTNQPITRKEEINRHSDPKIDQDFKGYPHGPAKDEIINPKSEEEKEIADIDNKDGEKRKDSAGKDIDEQDSDGSANAFENK